MDRYRRKANKYAAPITLLGIFGLSVLSSQSPQIPQIPQAPIEQGPIIPAVRQIEQKPDELADLPLQDDGPSSGGTTTITVTNGIPHPLFFAIQKKQLNISPCPTCKIYKSSSEIPQDICDFGTKATIEVNPGLNYVHWHYQNAKIGPINARWKLAPGRKYSTCIVMDLSKGRSNWDSK